MQFNKPLKYCAVIIAVAAPVAIGWAVTAGASIGGDQGLEGSTHTVDVYEIDGYEIERENIDGDVTTAIVDPNGEPVSIEDVPSAVADAVSNWQAPDPSESPIILRYEADGACYEVANEFDDGWSVVSSDGDRTFAAHKVDGLLTAKLFDDVDPGALDARLVDGESLVDIAGGQDIDTC